MSYQSERTNGTQVIDLWGVNTGTGGPANFVSTFIHNLTGDYNGSRTRGLFDTNNRIKLNGTSYLFKNTQNSEAVYNVYDLVAAAYAAGYRPDEIDKALNTTFKAVESNLKLLDPSSTPYRIGNEALRQYHNLQDSAAQANVPVVQYMNQYTVPSIGRIADRMNATNPAYQARIETRMNKDGETYTYTLYYIDPTTGKSYKHALDAGALIDADGTIPEENLNTWLRKEGLENVLNVGATAEHQTQLGEAALKALGYTYDKDGNVISTGNVGSNANAHNDFTQADWDAITALAPDTKHLQAWNKSKDANIFNNVYKNMTDPNADPDLIGRSSLEKLQALAGNINEQIVGTTQRNINNQRQQLLQQIKNDPELYNAITQQLRTDNAAGTIAGQRAANAQKVAAEAEANYDKSASDLYAQLFTGDNAVAGATRSNVYGNQTNALDQYITGMLNNMSEAARQGQITTQDLSTFTTTLGEMLGLDVSKYSDAAADASSKADKIASEKTTKISGDTTTAIAAQDAKLKEIADTLGIGEDYLRNAANGSADVTAALGVVSDALATAGQGIGGNYKAVKAPDVKETEKHDDKQYNDFMSQDFSKWLADDTIDSLTKQKTLQALMNEYDLNMLTEDELKKYYEGYAGSANEQSNKVFNEAQRAYIAAVTAGDAKTTEQLVKLATNASTSKQNLYAASALSNQYKQQLGLGSTGKQLATDAQNQAAANLSAIAQAGLDANKALTGYLGNGSDTYDKGTLYGAYNTFNQNSADARKHYSGLGIDVANTTKGINNINTQLDINNRKRLSDAANSITLDNVKAAANNITNSGTRKTIGTGAQAIVAQSKSTKK